MSSNLQDSGQRREEVTGAQTDPGNTECAMELLSPYSLMRLAQHLGAGASKYAPRNWEKGIKFSVCVGKLLRHFMKWQQGQTDEDHLAAVGFWWHALSHFEETQRVELDDVHGGTPSDETRPIKSSNEVYPPTSVKDLIQGPPGAYAPSSKIRIYVSHPIRGATGSDAEIERNKGIAQRWGVELRLAFPDIDWYIPTEHDEVLQILLSLKQLSIEGILTADCHIIDRCQGLLLLDWCDSSGCCKEWDYALARNIPTFTISRNLAFYSETFSGYIREDLEKFVKNL